MTHSTRAGISARQAALPPTLQELHRAILRRFLTTGAVPTTDWLRGRAAELSLDPAAAIAQLDAVDLVHIDGDAVSVAYPFSGTPTAHCVELTDTPAVYAMCAIDALGIPVMAGRDGIITSIDPHGGDPIRIECRAGSWQWHPDDAIVLRANTGASEALHCCSCPYTNFHTSPRTASAYLTAHEQLAGQILQQNPAIDEGRRIFGRLLNE